MFLQIITQLDPVVYLFQMEVGALTLKTHYQDFIKLRVRKIP